MPDANPQLSRLREVMDQQDGTPTTDFQQAWDALDRIDELQTKPVQASEYLPIDADASAIPAPVLATDTPHNPAIKQMIEPKTKDD